MPKMKTHSGCKKRFRVNSSGKVKAEGCRQTTPRKMSNKQRRAARAGAWVRAGMAVRIKRMLVNQ
jgi:ribosomal protein L35